MRMRVASFYFPFGTKLTSLAMVEFGQDQESPIRQNKPCHPNPNALVGNSLTGNLGVIEVVKAR